MGYASHEGKAWAISKLRAMNLKQNAVFLDLGAGAGSWMEAVRPWFDDSKWFAMEAWKPYVERFCLFERYHLVRVEDVRTAKFNPVDVVILGDVLEHMSEDEALDVWKRARDAARVCAIFSTPIIDYPQGHVHGNPLQEHVSNWSYERCIEVFEGITDSQRGSVVGTFVAAVQ